MERPTAGAPTCSSLPTRGLPLPPRGPVCHAQAVTHVRALTILLFFAGVENNKRKMHTSMGKLFCSPVPSSVCVGRESVSPTRALQRAWVRRRLVYVFFMSSTSPHSNPSGLHVCCSAAEWADSGDPAFGCVSSSPMDARVCPPTPTSPTRQQTLRGPRRRWAHVPSFTQLTLPGPPRHDRANGGGVPLPHHPGPGLPCLRGRRLAASRRFEARPALCTARLARRPQPAPPRHGHGHGQRAQVERAFGTGAPGPLGMTTRTADFEVPVQDFSA